MATGDFMDAVTIHPKEEKQTEKKKADYYSWVQIAIVVLIILLIGFGIGQYLPRSSSQLDSSTMAELTLAGTECALRSNDVYAWIPSIVPQEADNGNLIGIPVCVPIDKNTGQRVKKQ